MSAMRPLKAFGFILLCLFAFFLFVVAINIALSRDAEAHDFWINRGGYKGADGRHCCGQGDCKMVPEADVKITKGGYQLSIGELVPFSEAQQSEDRDYWRCERTDGVRRCFFAPMPGS